MEKYESPTLTVLGSFGSLTLQVEKCGEVDDQFTPQSQIDGSIIPVEDCPT